MKYITSQKVSEEEIKEYTDIFEKYKEQVFQSSQINIKSTAQAS